MGDRQSGGQWQQSSQGDTSRYMSEPPCTYRPVDVCMWPERQPSFSGAGELRGGDRGEETQVS